MTGDALLLREEVSTGTMMVGVHERIAVVGCVGAGKSTLARALGSRLGLPVVHLDRLWWQDGSYRIEGRASVERHTMAADRFRRLQHELAASERWVIDGTYTDDLDTRLPRATTLVWLDLPRRVCLWRLLRRHGRRRPDHPSEVEEALGWLLALAGSVLRYPRSRRREIAAAIDAHAGGAQVFRVRRRSQLPDVLAAVS